MLGLQILHTQGRNTVASSRVGTSRPNSKQDVNKRVTSSKATDRMYIVWKGPIKVKDAKVGIVQNVARQKSKRQVDTAVFILCRNSRNRHSFWSVHWTAVLGYFSRPNMYNYTSSLPKKTYKGLNCRELLTLHIFS